MPNQPSALPTRSSSINPDFSQSIIKSPTQLDLRKPPVVGATHEHTKGILRGKRNPGSKIDMDKSTSRLVHNFLARKPLLAQRMNAQLSCNNSPAGTESIGSGG